MIKKKHSCKCHKVIGGSVTCDLTCLRCSNAKKIRVTETKNYKKIEVFFK